MSLFEDVLCRTNLYVFLLLSSHLITSITNPPSSSPSDNNSSASIPYTSNWRMNPSVPKRDRFWAIAHRVNSEKVMDLALRVGANALEMDLVLTEDGIPAYLYHTCNCRCLVNTGPCPYIMGNYCEGQRNATQVLSHFMGHQAMGQVSLIRIDCKTNTVKDLSRGGQQVVWFLEKTLFQEGYQGKVFIFDYYNPQFHTSLAHNAMGSPYRSQIYLGSERAVSFVNDLTPSKMKASYFEKAEVLTQTKVHYDRRFFTIGTSICFQNIQYFYTEVVLGRINMAKGIFSHVTVWTVNEEADFDRYYDLGARSIMTDNIEGLVAWTKRKGYPLHALGDSQNMRNTMSASEVVTEIGVCDCDYRKLPDNSGVNSGGCVITLPPPPFSSCHCTLNRDQCWGTVVGCRDVLNKNCAVPDTSLTACLLGSGNCGGYDPESCGCHMNSDNTSCEVSRVKEDCACQCQMIHGGGCKSDIINCTISSSSAKYRYFLILTAVRSVVSIINFLI